MKLIRLKIENWRGVAQHEIAFGDGVNVIEGPNEIGKSSLFEALRLLFSELDSTAKVSVKAVQPVGLDLGSLVEAEFATGPYHATYTKRFNRQKSTSLEIHSPRRELLTGREAHERAGQLLEQTMDVDLWQALQVIQGGEVSQAWFKDSGGLARALDAAAGEKGSDPDGDLLERVTEEYHRYFTPRSGKLRAADAEARLAQQRQRLGGLREELKSIQADIERCERLTLQHGEISGDLPEMAAGVKKLEQRLRSINDLRQRRDAAGHLLEETQARASALAIEQQRRQALVVRAAEAEQDLERLKKQWALSQERIIQADAARRLAGASLEATRQAYQDAAEHAGRMDRLEKQVLAQQELERLQQLTEQLSAADEEILAAEARLAKAAMTEPQYRRLEVLDGEWRQARALLEMGAPELQVTAGARATEIRVDGQAAIHLDAGAGFSRIAAEDTTIRIADIARVEVRPGSSLSALREAESRLSLARESLMAELGAGDMRSAVARREESSSAEQALTHARARLQALLAGTSREQLSQRILQLNSRLTLSSPADGSLQPQQVQQQSREAQAQLQGMQAALEEQRSADAKAAEARIKAEAEAALHGSRRDAAAQRLHEAVEELETLRRHTPDARLEQSIRDIIATVDNRSRELERLEAELRAQDPESLQAVFDNARQAWQRAKDELKDIGKTLAVLNDRLERAQVSGLFEQLSNAESEYDAAQGEHQQRQRRAAAARCLYTTLKRHRDDARRAYIAPLKKQLETLGRVVFGSDFAVELDENLQVSSRFLNGKLLAFEALSIGAKEQLGILMRLAAAQLVATDGGGPLILDDTLGYSDPVRVAAMGAALSLAGKDAQILVLTCTSGRFRNIGDAHILRLEDSQR